jgi:hypothetical protein
MLLLCVFGTVMASVNALGGWCVAPVFELQESGLVVGVKSHYLANVAVAECLVKDLVVTRN